MRWLKNTQANGEKLQSIVVVTFNNKLGDGPLMLRGKIHRVLDARTLHRIFHNKFHFRKYNVLLLFVSNLLLLSGCFHNDDDSGGGGPTNADPTGYYEETGGSATVKQDDDMTDLVIVDLQALVRGNEIKMFSVAEGLLYDTTITSVSGNDYSGNATIYRDGVEISTATVSGMITQGSTISGTLTGSGAGNGSFELMYAMTNNQLADLSAVDLNAKSNWFSSNFDLIFQIETNGAITALDGANVAPFEQCLFDGDFVPVSNTAMYTVTLTFSDCLDTAVDGVYSGLAASQSSSILVTAVSNGTYAAYAEFQ